MHFEEFRDAVKKQFDSMSKNDLFVVDVDKDELWNTYLDAFPAGTNEVFRVRRKFDCSCCRHFIKNVGVVVAVVDGKVSTVWDIKVSDEKYQTVADTMSEYIKSKNISDVFLTKFGSFGQIKNFGEVDGKSVMFEHFHVEIPNKFLHTRGESIDSRRGELRSIRNVFKRSLDELSLDSVDTVLELISQNSLYKGEEWKKPLTEFRKFKKEYDKIADDCDKELFAWENLLKAGPVIGKIRNHSIGTLLIDISNGEELDKAVTSYERIVAPTNYKRPKAIFTKKMLDDAKKKVEELGFTDSLPRRFACLDDITINNILFSNRDSAKRIEGADDIFADMEKDVKSSPKKFSKVEEIAVEKFVKEVLPNASELEVYFENKHSDNMVSLIAPVNKDAKSMFKWDNPFSWAYSGNITDSMMKERVKSAGGKVDGDLRFSIQWNDYGDHDENDLDAHCKEPSGEEIMFSHKNSRTGGMLDVDITHPSRGVPAVENITWADRRTMKSGVYKFFVHQYANRGGRNGFRAEIEFDGQIHSFSYENELRQDQNVEVAYVVLDEHGNFSIQEKLPSSMSSKEVWGISTNQFVPVSVVCYSPNYWDEQNGIGNKHYFFMLKGCVNPENPNGFYNEFLMNELDAHKRVFEALGSKMRVADIDDQLSGIGFSSTKRAELVVKVKGKTERILKVMF